MSELTINVESVKILKTDGTDIISIYFDGEAPFPGLCNSRPCLTLDVSANTAEEYMKKNFPNLPYEVANIRSGKYK